MVLEYCNQGDFLIIFHLKNKKKNKGDLRKLLNEKKRLSELEATKILYQIVEGY